MIDGRVGRLNADRSHVGEFGENFLAWSSLILNIIRWTRSVRLDCGGGGGGKRGLGKWWGWNEV